MPDAGRKPGAPATISPKEAGMNQKALVRQVAADTGLGTAAATAAVKAVLAALTGAVAGDEAVRLPRFGTLYVTLRPRHTVRIPRTGALVTWPATREVSFRPDKKLREAAKAGQEKPDSDDTENDGGAGTEAQLLPLAPRSE